MGVAAGLGAWFGGVWFSLIVVLVAVAALREWHRLVNPAHYWWEAIATGLALIVAVYVLHVEETFVPALIIITVGACIAALIAALWQPMLLWSIPWHAFGVFYIGLPSLVLLTLRNQSHGLAIVGAIFVAVWTADTGALVFGRLIGGAKLAPGLSPNKTWAGFIGGTLAGCAAETFYVWIINGSVAEGAVLGICLALAAHCGDLFESWVKRQFRAKNTGRLIPGHGGMLDRIDSLLFAVPACTGLFVLFGINPFGV